MCCRAPFQRSVKDRLNGESVLGESVREYGDMVLRPPGKHRGRSSTKGKFFLTYPYQHLVSDESDEAIAFVVQTDGAQFESLNHFLFWTEFCGMGSIARYMQRWVSRRNTATGLLGAEQSPENRCPKADEKGSYPGPTARDDLTYIYHTPGEPSIAGESPFRAMWYSGLWFSSSVGLWGGQLRNAHRNKILLITRATAAGAGEDMPVAAASARARPSGRVPLAKPFLQFEPRRDVTPSASSFIHRCAIAVHVRGCC